MRFSSFVAVAGVGPSQMIFPRSFDMMIQGRLCNLARSRKGNRFAGGKPVLTSFRLAGMTPRKLCCSAARFLHAKSARTWR